MTIQKIKPRIADVGGIPVARALPNRERRTIGSWCFLDHAGPARFEEGNPGMQVGEHPHINLQTFTWMLEGEVLHKDSLGNEQLIRRKQVNLMTAGHGIAHTEQTPPGINVLHAVQLWIALPQSETPIAPAFEHYPQLPEWMQANTRFTLLTGEFAGRRAPTRQFTPLVCVDIEALGPDSIELALNPEFEYGLFLITGAPATINDELFELNEVAFLGTGKNTVRINTTAESRLLLLGGTPIDVPDFQIWWNFVGSRNDIIQAQKDWNAHDPRFGKVDTDMQRLTPPDLPWVDKAQPAS